MNLSGNNHEKFDYEKSLKKRSGNLTRKLGFVDKYVNRPLASLLVQMVYHTPITPNGLTCISFVIGLLGVYFFTRGEYTYFVLGGILAQLSSIIDGADGMLARSKNLCSDYGAHLDLFFDRIFDFALIVGIAVGAGIYFKSSDLLILGLLTAGLYLLQINLFYLTKNYLQVKQTGETGEFRAILMWAVSIFAVVNRLDILIYLGFAETVINNLVRLVHFLLLGKKKIETP